MPIPFQNLYEETEGFKELREHLEAFVERHAVKRAFARESVEGVADAKEIIDAAFNDLDEKFGKREPAVEPRLRSPR